MAPADTFSFEPLPRGGYNLLARLVPHDPEACWAYRWFDLSQPKPFTFKLKVSEDPCTAELQGGTPPYTGWIYTPLDSIPVVDWMGEELPINSIFCHQGFYSVRVVDTNGCLHESNLIIPRKTQLDENDQLTGKLLVYPNPTTGMLTLQALGFELAQSTIAVYDVLGRLQLNVLASSSGSEQQLDLSSLSAGVYQLRLRAANGELFSQRVLITN